MLQDSCSIVTGLLEKVYGGLRKFSGGFGAVGHKKSGWPVTAPDYLFSATMPYSTCQS